MRKKRQLAPSRLSELGDLFRFDQGNGTVSPADEGLYRDDEHTAVPEHMQRVSFRI